MSIRAKYENELNCVFNKLIAMCRDTELAIEKSVNALKQRDRDLAKEVISEDKTIDNEEREIEQDCLKILLGLLPVPRDLIVNIPFQFLFVHKQHSIHGFFHFPNLNYSTRK